MAARRRDLELDEALESIGGSFGKFQLISFALLFLVAIFHGARMTSSAFFLYEPTDHRCAIPSWPGDTFAITNEAQAIAYNMTIPPKEKCYVYSQHHNFSYDSNNQPINGSQFLQACPSGSVFSDSELKRNALTKFNFVCDASDYKTYAASLLYVGSLIGAALLGYISDRFGRKVCLLLSVSILLAFGTPIPWVPNFAALGIFQFMTGAATTGMFAAGFVMVLELVEPKHRKNPGLVMQMFFSLGEFLLVASFKGLQDWRWVNLIITVPTLFFLSYHWMMPESLRWLKMKKKYDLVSEAMARIASVNGKALPMGAENGEDLERFLQSYESANDGDNDMGNQRNTKRDSFFDLFKSCVLCQRSLVIFFNWFSVNLCFYGFVLNSGHIGNNIYLTFTYGTLVEIPAHLTSLLLVGRVGRKPVHCFLLLITVLSSGAAIGVAVAFNEEHEWVIVLLSMIGKYGASGLMGTSFLWMTELFPTSVRSSGLGVGNSCARIGAILSPYIVHWGSKMEPQNIGKAMPFMVFCAVSLLAFLLDLLLPETNKRDLPDTIQEAKLFGLSTEADAIFSPSGTVNYGALRSSGASDPN